MKIYASIANNTVQEVFLPVVDESGEEVLIENRFTPEFVSSLVDVTAVNPLPECLWSFRGGVFIQPKNHSQSPGEVLSSNVSMRDLLVSRASVEIAVLQDAIDLGSATEHQAEALISWKKYRLEVNQIDLTSSSPVWPQVPS